VASNVAKLNLRVVFEELLGRFEDFRLAGRPERLVSNFVSGYKHVPITGRRRATRPAGAPV